MAHGDSPHYTRECEVVFNQSDRHGKLYAVREAGFHATSTHRMRGEGGDIGMDMHTDISDTKDGPETIPKE
jgi:hypothetical protein